MNFFENTETGEITYEGDYLYLKKDSKELYVILTVKKHLHKEPLITLIKFNKEFPLSSAAEVFESDFHKYFIELPNNELTLKLYGQK